MLPSALLTQTREEGFPSVSKKVCSELVTYSDWKKKGGGRNVEGGPEDTELALGDWFSVSPFLSANSFLKLPVEKNRTCHFKKEQNHVWDTIYKLLYLKL